ncbi:carboxypeptidase-like regulatory domain-containing protein [Mariniflexile sp.]|uniref:carboxypeptidase-like regulatory domain-containing protein n=1 Tax=Mariniflexile sp. TaxID=1979402 RepID=UPI004047E03F
MKKVISIVALTLINISLFAQDGIGNIKATILTTTNTPLGSSSVSLINLPDNSMADGKITDETGIVFFKDIPVGNYSLSISHLGYQKKKSIM